MTKDEIILAQQARIEQLKESALRILRNKRGNDDWLILTIDCVGLEETLSIPDDLSALRAHDEKLRAVFQAGAASRDAEVVSLTNQRTMSMCGLKMQSKSATNLSKSATNSANRWRCCGRRF